MKKALWDAFPRWLLTWLVCVALNPGLGALLKVDSRWWLAAPVLLLWCALLAAAEHFGGFRAMLALWAAALGLCLLLSDRAKLAEAALAVLNRSGAGNGREELVLLLLCSAFALLFSALLRFYWTRAALSLAWIALWTAAALLEWPIPRLVPAALSPLLLLTLAETVRRLRREAAPGEKQQRALLLTLLPAALLLALLPTSAEPYEYPLLHSVADAVEQFWHDTESALYYRQKGDREFSLSFNGVSDEAAISDGVGDAGSSAIYAKAGRESDGALYLFGNAWEHFDGRGWSSKLDAKAANSLNRSLDTAEHIYALWRMLDEESRAEAFSDYFRTNSVYLNCRNMNIRTLFCTMDTTYLYTDAERYPFTETPVGNLFDFVQQGEVWYRVYFLESNARTRDSLIAASEGWRYDSTAHWPLFGRVALDFGDSFQLDLWDSVNLERTLAAREALIRRVYLDRSAVSERSAALAEEITAGCGSDYARVKAIAAYLQQNYSYTLRPAPVPGGENFLDWLLFEGREGYCTWYATAAVLLSRSVGVPARYVQGYRGELNGTEFTLLSAENAHAWCECYISGYGWVTLEATPGFSGSGSGWQPTLDGRAHRERPAESAAAPEEKPRSEQDERGEEAADTPTASIRGGSVTTAEEPEDARPRFAWLPPLIAAVLLSALLGILLWRRGRRKRLYQRSSPSARLMMDLELLLRDLRGKGYPRRPEESLHAYFARVPWRYLLVRESEAEEIAALYDRSFFGRRMPSEAELEKHRAFAARFRPRNLRQWLIWYRLQL